MRRLHGTERAAATATTAVKPKMSLDGCDGTR